MNGTSPHSELGNYLMHGPCEVQSSNLKTRVANDHDRDHIFVLDNQRQNNLSFDYN